MILSTQNFLVNLTDDYGLISLTGPEVVRFLQGQLTCDVNQVTEDTALFGAFCNPQGRIRALFRIFLKDNHYYLYLPQAIIPQTLLSLKKYAKFSKITIEEASHLWSRWGILGPDATRVIETLRMTPTIRILNIPSLEPRFILIGPQSTMMSLVDTLQNLSTSNQSYHLVNFNDWKQLDIKNRIPEIWPETIEQFLPHDINLIALGAVSFNKGCYCGQEIIARMEYRSKLKKHLIHKVIENMGNIPLPGSVFENDIVLSSCIQGNNVELLLQTRI